MSFITRVLLSSFLVMLFVAPAAAQSSGGSRFSIGAAAGRTNPLHGDFDFTPVTWQADVRFAVARHFGFNVFFEEWRHVAEDVRTTQTITAPQGGIGTVDRITSRTEHVTRTAGWNALLIAPLGRVTVTGGGGIGALSYARESSRELTGCRAAVASVCDNPRTASRFTNGSFSAQLEAGVDVGITRWLAASAHLRSVVPIDDPGGTHVTYTGGLRVRF